MSGTAEAERASLVEVFSSVQGEGPEVGRSTVFVRFGGCDLRCRWCDSPGTWRESAGWRLERAPYAGVFEARENPVDVDELVRLIDDRAPSPRSWISLTGGEPLLQPRAVAALSEGLSARGRRVYLETHGVPVVGYGTNTLPAFYARESDFSVDYRADTPVEVADALRSKWDMGLEGGMVVAVPVPAEHALDREEIDAVIDEAILEMQQQGITGKDTTPFLLARIAESTGGRSLDANIQLVINNARVAASIAAA